MFDFLFLYSYQYMCTAEGFQSILHTVCTSAMLLCKSNARPYLKHRVYFSVPGKKKKQQQDRSEMQIPHQESYGNVCLVNYLEGLCGAQKLYR